MKVKDFLKAMARVEEKPIEGMKPFTLIDKTKPRPEETEEQRLKREHIVRRDFVWKKLREEIHSREEAQKETKKISGASNMSTQQKKEVRHEFEAGEKMKAILKSSIVSNAKVLTQLYEVVRFIRVGSIHPSATRIETFFNEHFKKNQKFRSEFWTYWNAREDRRKKENEGIVF